MKRKNRAVASRHLSAADYPPERIDALIEQMRTDLDSDWPTRLLNALAGAALVSEEEIDAYGWHVTFLGRRALSEKELDALAALSRGGWTGDCARRLGIDRHTFIGRVKSARFKLGARNSTHAVTLAIRQGLIS